MRDRIYIHVDGRMVPAWGPNTPSYARMAGRSGTLVVGEPTHREVHNQKRRTARAAQEPTE